MKNINLNFKNNLQSNNNKTFNFKKLSRYYEKIFSGLRHELNNNKKTINVLNNKFEFNFKLSDLKKFKKFQTIAIIGMGGSILGIECIYNFLEKKIKKKVYFFNDLNEKKILDFKKKENTKNVLFLIISKSGNTLETITNTFSLNIIKNKASNIIIISERKNNYLYDLSKKLNLFYVEHKSNIGGRYSVLSEVGVVPAYLMNLNIKKLRSQLLDFFKGSDKSFIKNSSLILANILNSKKKNNLIFLNYAPELEKFLFWAQQLIAESLGKKNKGFLPVISNVPKDHHSLLQLYLDGPKDKLFYIFCVNSKSNLKFNFKNTKNKNHILNNKSLSEIKNAQKNALIKSLSKKNIPFRIFEINKIDEQVIGKLFSYFIMETILIGKIINTNPFDQPAVEQVKLYTKKMLS